MSNNSSQKFIARTSGPLFHPAEHDLFANYCHDSYAHFKPFKGRVESTLSRYAPREDEGYLHYRIRFQGDDTRLSQLERSLGDGNSQAG